MISTRSESEEDNERLIVAHHRARKLGTDFRETAPNLAAEHTKFAQWLDELYLRRTGQNIPWLSGTDSAIS
jgi:hypothetical protein